MTLLNSPETLGHQLKYFIELIKELEQVLLISHLVFLFNFKKDNSEKLSWMENFTLLFMVNSLLLPSSFAMKWKSFEK